MTRLQDFALGAGICTLLLALVACAVQMVLEVLAVERDRRKASGEVPSEARRTPDPARSAPSPDDDLFAETVRRAHPDITEWR